MTNREDFFHRSRAITSASLATLRSHPRLFAFPLLAFFAHVTYAAMWATLFGLRVNPELTGIDMEIWGAGRHGADSDHGAAGPMAGLLAYCGFQLITVASAVALSHAALEALAGRPWSVGAAFQRVRSRQRAIAAYAVIRATAGWVLRSGGSRRGRGLRAIRGLGRWAWWALTYLTVPVLAREERGAVASIERSAALLRLTWKEGSFERWSIRWLWVPLGLACGLPLLVGAGAGVEDGLAWFVLILLSSSCFGLGGVAIATLDGIYRSALYVFATEGVVPEPFDDPDLHTLWVPAVTSPAGGTPDATPDEKEPHDGE